MRIRYFFFSIFLLLNVAPAQASSFYWELGPGVGLVNGGTGLGFNTTLGFNTSKESSIFQIHLGAKVPVASGSGGSIAGIYPLLRLEFPRFYIGGGVTPLMYGGTSSLPTTAVSTVGIMGEVGLLWRVVPFFFLALEGTTQMASSVPGVDSPVFGITLQMRFFIFQSDENVQYERGRRENFDGWRYPFGIEIFGD